MHKPRLLVIAGCNGSGKSSFSRSLVPSDSIIPFDYDFHFLSRAFKSNLVKTGNKRVNYPYKL